MFLKIRRCVLVTDICVGCCTRAFNLLFCKLNASDLAVVCIEQDFFGRSAGIRPTGAIPCFRSASNHCRLHLIIEHSTFPRILQVAYEDFAPRFDSISNDAKFIVLCFLL